MKPFDPPAIIRTVEHEAEEQALVERAQQALSNCNWTVGECASKWVQPYVPGRTDADFGERIDKDRQWVSYRKLVWEKFHSCPLRDKLSWTHFREALNWEDAFECLDWANEMGATVAEMKAWRRAQRGDDSSESETSIRVETQSTEPLASSSSEKKRAASPASENNASRGIDRRNESPIERSPAGAKQEPREDCGEEVDPTESPKVESAPPPGFSVHHAIMQVRSIMHEVDEQAESTEKEEVADELRQWELRFRPVKVSAAKGFTPPTVEEVRAYCKERNNSVDPQQFVDYYEMKGWMAGKVKMRSWRAAVRTWESYDKKERANGKADGRVRSETNWDIPISEDYSDTAEGD